MASLNNFNMEDTAMKRKPKMHNEDEFNLDNYLNEDDNDPREA